jgi:hypothetical protein
LYKVRLNATENSGWNEDHSAYVTKTVYSISSDGSDELSIVNSKVPKKGKTSNPSGKKSSRGHGPRTGDDMPLADLLLLISAGLAASVITIARGRRS